MPMHILKFWISKLEGLAVDIKSIDASLAISDQELMVKILANLPSEYDVILDGLKSRLNITSEPDALTLEDIHEKLGTQYVQIKANKEDKLEKKEEKALYTSKYNKLYKGRCVSCGELGHKIGYCPEKEENQESCF